MLVEHAQAMIHQHNLPYSLWKEAIAYATYLKNRSPMCAIKDHKVPDEVFWGKKPNMTNLEEFSKTCWVLQQNGENSKLDLKSRQIGGAEELGGGDQQLGGVGRRDFLGAESHLGF